MNRLWYGMAMGLAAAAGTSAVAVQSCGTDEPCTVEAQASVEVALVDLNGDVLEANSVWYSAKADDGQEDVETPLRADCIDDACTYWVAGRELPGSFEIGAAACGEVQTRTVDVAMDDSDCNVGTERVEFRFDCDARTQLVDGMPPPPPGGEQLDGCSPDPAPSVRVTVVDAETGSLRPVERVGYSMVPFSEQEFDLPAAPTAARARHRPAEGSGWCASDLCDVWHVGQEAVGRFTVWAEGCDSRTETVSVDVARAACHVETQDVLLTLDCEAPAPVSRSTLVDEPRPPGPTCTLEARPSLVVEPVDAITGDPMAATAAGYSRRPFLEEGMSARGDDAPRPTTASVGCESGVCDEFRLGSELAGRFEVWVEACGERSEPVEVEVPMTEDGCHVQTQTVQIELECSGCTPPHEHGHLARR